MSCVSRFFACLILLVLFANGANADLVGDEIEASLTIDPDQSLFNESAISGTAIVVDPGREFQGQAYSTPNGVDIDVFVDINDTELTFGFERTDSSNGGFGSGLGRTLTLLISDIDWTGNPIQVEFLRQSTFGGAASHWQDDPANYLVTTSSTTIQIDFPSGYGLSGDGGFITATYGISSVPEPSSIAILALVGSGGLFVRRKI